MTREKVLILNTGGTIGMVNADPGNPSSPLRPARNLREITEQHPVLSESSLGVETGYYQFDPLLDSSDMTAENWIRMAQAIEQFYDDYTGFVILHGTDTMCYSASALSFMLENLEKPVIITGSQVPMVKPRSDAVQNLVTAIHLAAPETFGHPLIPEVCIFFRDVLLRGNRSRKLSSSGFAGFSSPNYPQLARAGEYIDVNRKFVHQSPEQKQEFFVNTALDTRVMVLEIYPGFDPSIIRALVKSQETGGRPVKGIILKTFGAGNAPRSSDFLTVIEEIVARDIVVVNVTQCPEGMVKLGLYEASAGLLNRGVIGVADMTPEAAVAKLMHLLGRGWPVEEVKRMMQIDLRGELSLNIHNIEFAMEADSQPMSSESAAPCMVLPWAGVIPGGADFGSFQSATLYLRDVHVTGTAKGDPGNRSFEDRSNDSAASALKLFINQPSVAELPNGKYVESTGIIIHKLLSDVVSTTVSNVHEGTQDVVIDVSRVVRHRMRAGEMATVSVSSEPDRYLSIRQMHLSIHTMA